ncbi:hypothetical protein [Bifidobacterium sp. ESL0764]|uniref:hypothetical protein n=1 Tax=Bifidobacterium sp. ESL0764 TaxID=2983228 RepID=UPI0023F6CB2E|nr:hypothetical protein [Bifidobacterium sp. ESL0764]WEV65804.1 hypothetical protein OZX71_00015 [Bifidobacterium sp. ESL0764]
MPTHQPFAPYVIKDTLRSIGEEFGDHVKAEPPVIVVAVGNAVILLIVDLFSGLFTSAGIAGIAAIIPIAALLSNLFAPTFGAVASFLGAIFDLYLSTVIKSQGNVVISEFALVNFLPILITSELMLGYLKRWGKLAGLLPVPLMSVMVAAVFINNATPGKPMIEADLMLFGLAFLMPFPWIMGLIGRWQNNMRSAIRQENELRRATMRLETEQRSHRMAVTLHNKVMKELNSIRASAGRVEALSADGRRRISEEAKNALNEMHQVINIFDEQPDTDETIDSETTVYDTLRRMVHRLPWPGLRGKGESRAQHRLQTTSQAATYTTLWRRPASSPTGHQGVKYPDVKYQAGDGGQEAANTETNHGSDAEAAGKPNGATDQAHAGHARASHIHVDRFTATTIVTGLASIILLTLIPSTHPRSLSFLVGTCMALTLIPAVFLPTAGPAMAFMLTTILIPIPVIPKATVYTLAICSGILLGYSRRRRLWTLGLCTTMTAVLCALVILARSTVSGYGWLVIAPLMYLGPWAIGQYARHQQGLNQTAWINSQLSLKTAQLNKERYDTMLADAVHDSITNELSSVILLTDDPNRDWSEQTLQLVEQAVHRAYNNTGKVIDLLNGNGNGFDEFIDASRDVREWLVVQLAHEDSLLQDLGYTGISQVRGQLAEGEQTDTKAIEITSHLLTEIYTNIIRHSSPGIDSYILVAELENGYLNITETNDCSGPGLKFKESEHGKGLELHKKSVKAIGGTLETSAEDGSWIVNCTVPLVPVQKNLVPDG